ncbi:MAG: addiction module antidote protein [Rhodospirillaceae bacterium]
MAKTETYPWDAADHLDSPVAIAAYLNAALEDGDPALIVAALGDIARSRGMNAAGSNKAVPSRARPEFTEVVKTIQSLGLRLSVTPAATTGTNLPC